MINLVLQSFGNESILRQGVLCILTFLAQHSSVEKKVLVFTDQEMFFRQYIDSHDVVYIPLTDLDIREMKGEIDFIHRVKICIIERALNIVKDRILYVDSDTFFTKNIEDTYALISPGTSVMHLEEFAFGETEHLSEVNETKILARQIKGGSLQFFESRSACDRTVNLQFSSWNAGVIGLDFRNVDLLSDVFRLTDVFYKKVRHHAAEQFAFSHILSINTKVLACDEYIYHYWYRIKKQIIEEFLILNLPLLSNKDETERRRLVLEWTKMLPSYFDNHILTLKDAAMLAFNANSYRTGYKLAGKVLLRAPFSEGIFMRDVLYHTKRWIS